MAAKSGVWRALGAACESLKRAALYRRGPAARLAVELGRAAPDHYLESEPVLALAAELRRDAAAVPDLLPLLDADSPRTRLFARHALLSLPLEPLLAGPEGSEIMINGPDQVFVERAGRLEESSPRFSDSGQLMLVIDRIVSSIGRRVDESSPMADARFRDGSRVNVVIPPLASAAPASRPPDRGTT